MKFRTFLLGFSALLVAGCAAYFSVTGLSKLFAGETQSVIIMAGSLELAKLVAAGFVYNYWEKLNKLLKFYLISAIGILMLITSGGIYGFLTSAYKETSDQLGIIDKQTEVIELKKNRYSEELANYNDERNQLNQSIGELSKGLANNTIQYKDKSTGQIITTTSSATRRVLTEQLADVKSQRESITEKIDVLNDSITSLDLQVLDLSTNNELAAEVGPLRYISDITGKDMDTVVNWFALLIVLVFDPLAVTLIISFSAAMKIDKGERDKKKIVENNYQVYGDTETDSIEEEEEEEEKTSSIWDDEELRKIRMEKWKSFVKEKYGHSNNVPYTESKVETDIHTTEHNLKEDFPTEIPFTEKELSNLATFTKKDVESESVNDAVNDAVNDKPIWDEETGEVELPKENTHIPTEFSLPSPVESTMELKNENEPNESLKEAYKKYKEERDTTLPNVDNPNWIEYENGGWKDRYKDNEYFYHPWFDWKKADRWIHNKHAVDYWMKYKQGTLSQLQKYKDMYPDSDTTTVY